MGTISIKSGLMFCIDNISDERDDYLSAKFKIMELESGVILKESYNNSLLMAYESFLIEDKKGNILFNDELENSYRSYYPPYILFEDNSIYISDYTGKLILWNWRKEPHLHEKEKDERGCGRSSITKTMLKSKFINENLFRCHDINLNNVVGLSEEQLEALKKTIFKF
jgi:hypothetical protein